MGGLKLLGFVCVKPERLNHCEAALRHKPKLLRDIPRVWPTNRILAAL